MQHRTPLFLLALLAAPLAAQAYTPLQEREPLVTDRPDAAESSETVGDDRFQVETSTDFTQDKDQTAGTTARTYSFPTLVRYGIAEPVEIRFESELFSFNTQTGTATDRGFNDFDVGLKAHFLDNSGAVPSFGVLAHVGVPVGKNSLSSNAVVPTVKILGDWELPAGFSLGTNLGMDVPARDAAGDKFAQLLYAAAVGHDIPGTNERARLFVEGAGAIPVKGGKENDLSFNSGVAVFLTPNVQLDAVTRVGLTDAAAGFGAGFGLSVRR